ncbi:MAG: class I SAM-dependent methyltransferase [Patescibacteria group bacterium]|nr:class I SAM-dependent methyltransferase [Patescibacteria group bacterium]
MPKAFYDSFDYAAYWQGRDYENSADRLAVWRLIQKISGPHEKILEVGVGLGRLIPVYEKYWKSLALLDPSQVQLDKIRETSPAAAKAQFVKAFADQIPLPNNDCDAAICVRVFHHLADPVPAVREISRVLKSGGWFILEIPNVRHFKNRLRRLIPKRNLANMPSEQSQTEAEEKISFVNHDPKVIKGLLKDSGFTVRETLSVSNLRSPLLKKILPVGFLLTLESRLQKPLSYLEFGPSLYLLSQKN